MANSNLKAIGVTSARVQHKISLIVRWPLASGRTGEEQGEEEELEFHFRHLSAEN